MKDNYLTIKDKSTGEFKDRGSKFIAFAFPMQAEEELSVHLNEVKQIHPKARHHCYAYRLGRDKNYFRANDDGEPSGTAGRPILGQIDSFELTNIFIVVVRYFGGTLLGTSGLINAYKTSAAAAIQNATIIEKTTEHHFLLTFDYSIMSNIMNALKHLNIEMLEKDFGDVGKIKIALPKSKVEDTFLHFRAQVVKIPLEMAEEMKNIAGLKIDFLEEV